VIDLLSGWARSPQAEQLIVTHQPDLASRAGRIVALATGRVAEG
jgi:predicted ABC-type transport system involved in lysophospholipase L1 biosynthesis ATPase subunit